MATVGSQVKGAVTAHQLHRWVHQKAIVQPVSWHGDQRGGHGRVGVVRRHTELRRQDLQLALRQRALLAFLRGTTALGSSIQPHRAQRLLQGALLGGQLHRQHQQGHRFERVKPNPRSEPTQAPRKHSNTHKTTPNTKQNKNKNHHPHAYRFPKCIGPWVARLAPARVVRRWRLDT